MSIFGWDLPAGVSSRDIDRLGGGNAPCDLCGVHVDACECPECPTCGTVGDVDCLKQHAMTLTAEQIKIGWESVGRAALEEARWNEYADALATTYLREGGIR